MIRRLSLTLLACLLLAAPATASAKAPVVGLGDQHPEMFSDPAFQSLAMTHSRYVLEWDWYRSTRKIAAMDWWMSAAGYAGVDPLIAFGRDWRPSGQFKLPSLADYRTSFKRFRARYPQVHEFSAWNEANHTAQPTANKPKAAARFYEAMRKACPSCTVIAADVLDSPDSLDWIKRFKRYAPKARLWGLHNYKDVNRNRSTGLRGILRTVPGEVWLTETGGIVKLQPQFKFSTSRASKATKFLFQLADRYDSRRAGNRSKMTRVYYYRWFGEPANSRFDAGLTDVNGKPRPAFSTFSRVAKRHR